MVLPDGNGVAVSGVQFVPHGKFLLAPASTFGQPGWAIMVLKSADVKKRKQSKVVFCIKVEV